MLSDTHFDDTDCKLMDPDWITPDEQLKIINSVVGKGDTFVCLGDVGNPKYIPMIKARKKILLLGNHDARIKIKSPAYIALHRAVTNKVFTVKRMAELFLQGTDFSKLAKDFPNEARIIKYYDWQFEEVTHNINEMVGYARALYEEYDHDRRAIASEIKDSPYAWAGFAAIGNDKSVEELMQVLSNSKLEKLIAEYCYR